MAVLASATSQLFPYPSLGEGSLHIPREFLELPILVMRDTKGLFGSLREWLSGVTASLTLPMDTDELVQTVKKYLN
jgi:hypothetical protein